jgi:hypothetical protein
LFISFACTRHSSVSDPKKAVYINKTEGKYSLYRNGQPFIVKGAAGYTHLKELKELGGNTIRIWDTVDLGRILDSARAYDLAVIVGLPLPSNNNMADFYSNEAKTDLTYKRISATVNHYKNHPAVLAWCLGNELPFPYKPQFNRFYTVFNKLTDMIHHDDPNHPVTTTVMSFQKKNLTNIKLRTNIDFVSFNIFGSIRTLAQDLDDFKWMWDGPFLITEWGIEGPWVTNSQNAWGSYVENTSKKKAEEYLDIYEKYMPVKQPRFLGSVVFYWGQKQEYTPTWFSLFDERGNRTEAVNVMHYIWTGKKANTHAPDVKYMLLDDWGAKDNILYNPNVVASARIYLYGTDTVGLKYKWELMREDWYKPNGIFNDKKPRPLLSAIIEDKGPYIRFKIPANEGPYRLFVYIYNKQGYYATSNTPFYVVKNP